MHVALAEEHDGAVAGFDGLQQARADAQVACLPRGIEVGSGLFRAFAVTQQLEVERLPGRDLVGPVQPAQRIRDRA